MHTYSVLPARNTPPAPSCTLLRPHLPFKYHSGHKSTRGAWEGIRRLPAGAPFAKPRPLPRRAERALFSQNIALCSNDMLTHNSGCLGNGPVTCALHACSPQACCALYCFAVLPASIHHELQASTASSSNLWRLNAKTCCTFLPEGWSRGWPPRLHRRSAAPCPTLHATVCASSCCCRCTCARARCCWRCRLRNGLLPSQARSTHRCTLPLSSSAAEVRALRLAEGQARAQLPCLPIASGCALCHVWEHACILCSLSQATDLHAATPTCLPTYILIFLTCSLSLSISHTLSHPLSLSLSLSLSVRVYLFPSYEVREGTLAGHGAAPQQGGTHACYKRGQPGWIRTSDSARCGQKEGCKV